MNKTKTVSVATVMAGVSARWDVGNVSQSTKLYAGAPGA